MRGCISSDGKEQLRSALIQKCWFYDEQLRAWAEAYYPTPLAFGLSCQPLTTTTPSLEQLIHAHCLSLYWTGCLLLYSTFKIATGAEAIYLPQRTDPRIYLRNIAKIIPVLLSHSTGVYGQHIAALPLGIALQYAMADDSMTNEQDILVRNFEGPRGHVLSGFLLSVNCDEPRHTEPLPRLDGPLSISARARSWVGT